MKGLITIETKMFNSHFKIKNKGSRTALIYTINSPLGHPKVYLKARID